MPGAIVRPHSSAVKPRIFYGWFVVAATFAVTFVGFGSAYSFSAFLVSLQHDFAASRGSVSLVFSLAGFALIYGVFYGGFVALAPAVVIDYFGGRNASGLIGILYTSVAFGTLIGPSAAGFAYDVSHSYTLPILASAGAYVIATAVLAATSRAPAA
jgi:MFS family permease